VVWALLGLLIAIHLVISLGGEPWRAWTNYAFAFIPARFGTQPFPQPQGAAWWSMLTYGLLHGDWAHVLTNCLWLAVFSKPVEDYLGTLRYLALLVVSVIAGAVASLIVHWGDTLIMVGISAGVSGVLAAAIPLMNGNFDERVADIRPLAPLELLRNSRALTFTVMWLGLTLLTASTQYMTGTAFLEQRVIAWDAHLGGFIAGLIAFYLLSATVQRKSVHTLH
jgi:membrane associated rhomboid family serine protease